MIVMKFGGTSVESAAAIESVAGIVKAGRSGHPVVVVSAMGKTTNRLLAIARTPCGQTRGALWQVRELRAYHLEHARQAVAPEDWPELDAPSTSIFRSCPNWCKGLAVLGELTPRSMDAISSYGERLSSLIVTPRFAAFGRRAVHVDARSVIVTDNRHTQAAPHLYRDIRAFGRTAAALPRSAWW